MNRLVYLLIIVTFFFTSCDKETTEDVKPVTQEELLQGTWTLDQFRMEYFNEAGTKIFERKINSDFAKITFDDANATMEYKSTTIPKVYPYRVRTIASGQTIIEYTMNGGIFFNRIQLLEKDKMIWADENNNPISYTDENGNTQQAKSSKSYSEFKR